MAASANSSGELGCFAGSAAWAGRAARLYAGDDLRVYACGPVVIKIAGLEHLNYNAPSLARERAFAALLRKELGQPQGMSPAASALVPVVAGAHDGEAGEALIMGRAGISLSKVLRLTSTCPAAMVRVDLASMARHALFQLALAVHVMHEQVGAVDVWVAVALRLHCTCTTEMHACLLSLCSLPLAVTPCIPSAFP
jgi:hypothetical protein